MSPEQDYGMLIHVALAALALGAADPAVVTITGTEFAFQAPDTVPAGLVTFKFVNRGQMFHQAQLVRLEKGRTVPELLATMRGPRKPLPKWAVEVGGPNAPRPGGGEANATMSLAPGTYALLCFVDTPDGTLHALKGMARTIVVTPPARGAAAAAGGAAPTPDVTLTMGDGHFRLSKPVKAGRRVFKVESKGSQPHEVELLKLAHGKTVEDLLAWMARPVGPAPGAPLGGIAALARGQSNIFTADLPPGDYAFVCFINDLKRVKPQNAAMMTLPFSVR